MQSIVLASAGVHPSVAWAPQRRRFFAVWQDGSRLETNEGRLLTLGGPQASYPRLWANSSFVWVGFRDGTETGLGYYARLSSIATTLIEPIVAVGPIHGSYPCAFGHSEFAFQYDGANAQYPVEVRSLSTPDKTGRLVFGAGAPVGLCMIDSHGNVLSWDATRGRIPGLFDVTYAGELCVGAADRDGQPCNVVLHPETGDELIIWPGQDSQNPVIAFDGVSTYAVVAWSGKGEGVRMATFDRAELRPPVSTRPAPFGVPTDAKSVGYFYDFGVYGAHHPARNCTVTGSGLWMSDYDGDGDQELPVNIDVQLSSAIDAAGRAFLAADPRDFDRPSIRDRWSKILAVWTHEPDDPAMARQWVDWARADMERAELPQRPVVTVLREELSADSAFAGIGDALSPEIYFRDPALTYDDMLVVARRRIDDVCRALSPSPLYLCIQAFNRNDAAKWTAELLEALQQAGNEALSREQVRGLFWFAYGRPGGTVDYPSVEAWHAAQVAVTTAPPFPVDPPTTPEPEPEPPTTEEPMYFPNDDQSINALQRIADAYVNVLKRAHGIFDVPPDGQSVAIPRPGEPAGIQFDTKSLAVWGMSRYIRYFNDFAGDHERAINAVLHDIRWSAEGQAANPQ